MTNTNDQPQPKPEIDMSFLTPMFDECYNTAIDRAILVVEELITHSNEGFGVKCLIINQLTQLKKQIP